MAVRAVGAVRACSVTKVALCIIALGAAEGPQDSTPDTA